MKLEHEDINDMIKILKSFINVSPLVHMTINVIGQHNHTLLEDLKSIIIKVTSLNNKLVTGDLGVYWYQKEVDLIERMCLNAVNYGLTKNIIFVKDFNDNLELINKDEEIERRLYSLNEVKDIIKDGKKKK